MHSRKAKKGHKGSEAENISDLKRLAQETSDFDEIVDLSSNDNADVRLQAVKRLCPCKVQKDIDSVWQRLFEMTEDDDARVRYQVLHNICDGSPDHLESQVVEAMEKFNRDEDREIRRRAHKVLASYLRTGKWNVL